jgi:hypothetical protein
MESRARNNFFLVNQLYIVILGSLLVTYFFFGNLFDVCLVIVNSFSYDPFFCCLLLPIYNVYTDKQKIIKYNKNKSGIYLFTNLINEKRYVGSAVDIKNRLKLYFSKKYIKDSLKRSNSHVYYAILKHGLKNFL